MRLFVLISIFLCGNAQARTEYINMFVPTALQTAGVSQAGWSTTTCTQCHGGTPSFANISAGARPFGTQFFSTATNMGITLVNDNMTDMNQMQVTAIINAMLPMDADGDGVSNQAEIIGRSDFNDPASTPATVGGGGGDDTCTLLPEFCAANGGGSGDNDPGRIVSADAAYQLNSSCGVVDQQARLEGKPLSHAGTPVPLVGFFFMWLLPVLVGLYRRQK